MDKYILDVCCGGRAFWFDKHNKHTVYCDKRSDGDIELCNGQTIHISPDVLCDFKQLPFDDDSFNLIVFDPPHLVNKSDSAWMVKKYGTLPENWQEELHKGFGECMRVLKPRGTLIFKWNEVQIPVSQIIEAIGYEPLFGHPSGKRNNTHWLCFMKGEQ